MQTIISFLPLVAEIYKPFVSLLADLLLVLKDSSDLFVFLDDVIQSID